MMDTGLQDKVVLVTGANHGIGATTARAFAAQGARVFIQYVRLPLSDEEGTEQRAQDAAEVVQAMRVQGGQVEVWEADLVAPAAIPPLFDRVEGAFGPVDVLVNNAAVGGAPTDTFLPLAEGALDRFERSLRTVTAASHESAFRCEQPGAGVDDGGVCAPPRGA